MKNGLAAQLPGGFGVVEEAFEARKCFKKSTNGGSQDPLQPQETSKIIENTNTLTFVSTTSFENSVMRNCFFEILTQNFLQIPATFTGFKIDSDSILEGQGPLGPFILMFCELICVADCKISFSFD